MADKRPDFALTASSACFHVETTKPIHRQPRCPWDLLTNCFHITYEFTRGSDLTPYEGSLMVAGRFETAGNRPSLFVARWTLTSTGVPEVVSPAIFSVYPNPFRASTTLLYELDHPGLVNLAVFDVQGRRVATLVEGFQEAGPFSHTWTGLDRFGNRLPSGVYYLRLASREQELVRSVVLAR